MQQKWEILKKAFESFSDVDVYGSNLYERSLTAGSLWVSNVEAMHSLESQLRDMLKPTEDQQRPKLLAAFDAVTNTELRVATTQSWLKHFPTIDDHLRDFRPAALKKTLSDGDGRFSLAYPNGEPLMLYVEAYRKVDDQTERYIWLIDSPTGSDSSEIFLSNQNLIPANLAGFFH